MDYLPAYTGTVLGWAIVVGGGGALYLYYKSDSRRRPVRAKNSRTTSNTTTDPQRSRAERRTTGQSSSSATNNSGIAASRSNKSKTETSSSSKAAKAPSTTIHESSQDEQEDDKSWAKDLARTQQGYSLKASDPSRQQSRQKTVKQSSANRVAAELSGDSSTAGADTQSPDRSPELPASQADIRSSGNVDDMLENPEDGPSVLRLTEPERFLPPKQKPAPKAPEQPETKKQRQNKKKAEERKQQQDELEQVRKAQLESQRRTAREARGEPAKNGMASAAAASAWTANVPKKETPVANGNPLLDTFVTDKVTTTDAPSKEAALRGNSSGAVQKPAIPSEEEQMRILLEEDDSAWKTVGTKKTKSKRKDGDEIDDGAVKPVNTNAAAPQASKPLQANGAYSLLSNDDDDGWTQA